MARPDKHAAVTEISELFRNSSATVLTEYRGLTVSQLKQLRGSLGQTTTYAVVKNTLTRLAAKDAGVEGIDEWLVGPSAIAFVEGDPVEAAKGLRTFAKDHPALVIKGGVMDGKLLSAADIGKLADLESREVLLSKLAGAMNASLQSAVSLFAAPLSQTARVVEALRAKVEAEAPAAEAPAAEAEAPAAEAEAPAAEAEAPAAEAEAPAAEPEATTESE
ncbi:MAG: 50S ribosomal protein L10 [Actinobacteria bacterium]|nr:50S ribosomal protein L10 [Actinomycetota bacterium]MCB9427451.1 50S ribosomal protein L10 [Actinomycetota bacterium]MCO5298426.1 50S ribosomal protein L10 [Candidatus Nanopelagicales bacterium]HPE11433.1 50S ribosomal protein L10 [Actinomycetota bacterium]HPQ82850.1 50S ribosomal protein L10 [Actinomycetota bacterium]